MRKLILILALVVSCYTYGQAAPEWRQTNGPFGGFMKKVMVNSKGDLFSLSDAGQLFKMAVGSDRWAMIGDGYNEVTIDFKDNILVGEGAGELIGKILLYDQNMNFVKIIHNSYDFDYMRRIVTTNTGGIYAIYPYGGLYFSNDEGDNWITLLSKATSQLAADSSGNAIYIDVYKQHILRYDSNQNTIDSAFINLQDTLVYAGDIEYNRIFNKWIAICSDRNIYFSSNTGATWEKGPTDLRDYFPYRIHVSSNGDIFLYSEIKSFKSTDGGDTWSNLEGFDSLDVWSFIEYNGDLVFANRSGIHVYNLNTKEISDLNNGLIASQVQKIAVDKEGVVYASAMHGLFRSTDEGDNWTAIDPPKGEEVHPYDNIFCSKSGLLFVYNIYDSWMSTDKGNTWNQLRYKLDTTYYAINVTAEDDCGRLYADGYGLSYSDDGAQTWDTIQIKGLNYGGLIAAHKDRVALATFQDGVFYSTNRGATFRKLPMDVPENYGTYCLFNSKGDFFVAMNAWMSGDAVFRTTDGGISFEDLPALSNGVRFIALDSSDYIYSTSKRSSLIRSKDNGDSWEYASDTSDGRLSVTDICFGSKNNAYIGTDYNGVFKTNEVKSVSEPTIKYKIKFTISPNPASERIAITLGKVEEPSEITIYNQLGEIVFRTQRSGESEEFDIPVAEFPLGAYFVKVSAGGEVLTGKFAVVR